MEININYPDYLRLLAEATTKECSKYEHIDCIVLQSNGLAYAINGKICVIASNLFFPWGGKEKRIALQIKRASDIPNNVVNIIIKEKALIHDHLFNIVKNDDISFPNVYNIIEDVKPSMELPEHPVNVGILPKKIVDSTDFSFWRLEFAVYKLPAVNFERIHLL